MNTVAQHIIDFLTAQSLHVLILFAVVLAVTILLRGRSAHIRYLLWLLIVAKCLVPPLHTVSLAVLPEADAIDVRSSGFSLTENKHVEARTANTASTDAAEDVRSSGFSLLEYPPTESRPANTVGTAYPTGESRLEAGGTMGERSKIGGMSFKTWIPAVWLGGAAVYFLIMAVKGVRFDRYVRRHRAEVTATSHPSWAGFLAAAVGERRVQVYHLSRPGQPFVWGLWRGAVYLPGNFADVNDSQKQQSILMHEAGHILRLDPLVNFLQVVAQGLFWFHPLVWAANRIIRAEREKCCDEFAVATLKTAPRHYCTAIVDALMAAQSSRPAIPTLAVAGPVKNIEDRIKTLLAPGKRFYTRPTLAVVLAILLLAAIVVPTTIALSHRVKPAAPIPRDGLYENAKASNQYKIKVGPTNYEAHSVVRYDRDGIPSIKNPDGSEKKVIGFETPDYSAQTPWMDIAQIYLSPERSHYDVIELRVFNHQTRQLLDRGDYPGIGYHIDDSVVSVYSIGKKLPDSLDIWMRVQHNQTKNYILQADRQASADIDGNTLRIVEMAKGLYNWANGIQTAHHAQWDESVTSVALKFDNPGRSDYQICAVGKDGRRVVPDFPHFLRPSNGWQQVSFGMPMDMIKHFELRPFQGRDRFFFENVKLPARNGKLDTAPPVRFPVDGAAWKFQHGGIPFSHITLRALPNTEITGMESMPRLGAAYTTKTSDKFLNSIVCMVSGLSIEKITFVAYDKDGNRLDIHDKGAGGTYGNNTTCYYVTTETAIDEIKTIDVYFGENPEIKTQNSAFIATLPNGVTVELVAICKPGNNKWWEPDGSEISDILKSNSLGRLILHPRQDQYGILFRLKGVSVYDTYLNTVMFDVGGISTEFGIDYQYISNTSTSSDVQLKVPAGLWSVPLEIAKDDQAKHEFNIGTYRSVALGDAFGKEGKTHLPVTFIRQLGATQYFVTFEAIDKNKRTYPAEIHYFPPDRVERSWDWGYELKPVYRFNVKPENIQSYRLKFRPLYTVTFKNVSLRAGMETEVEVVIDEGRLTRDEGAEGNTELRTQDAEFFATLANGVTVELLGVSEYTEQVIHRNWWAPDGTPLDKELANIIRPEFIEKEYPYRYVIAYQLKNEKNTRSPLVTTKRNNNAANLYENTICGNFSIPVSPEESRELTNYGCVIVTSQTPLETHDIALKYSSDMWEVAARHPAEEIESENGWTIKDVIGKTEIRVPMSLVNEFVPDSAIAIDRLGKVHYGYGAQLLSQRYHVTFNRSLPEFREFQIRRPIYEQVTFKNVSLRPSVKTEVVVEH